MASEDTSTDLRAVRRRAVIEVWIIVALGVIVYFASSMFDLLEWFADYSRTHEEWELDEFATVVAYLSIALLIFSIRRWREARTARVTAERRSEELKEALAEVRHLKGILPICSACKRIRDDEGYWHQVEEYLQEHADTEFTHGICPECVDRLYPELGDSRRKPNNASR